MTNITLPSKVEPRRLADSAVSLRGVLFVKDMARLSASLDHSEGDIEVNLTFGVDEQQVRFVRGGIRTSLFLRCQRCMDPFKYEIISHFALGFVRDEEEAARLPDRYEPALLTEEGMLMINELVEDELIMSLPIVALHDPKDCKVTLPFEAASTADSNAENPFNVIELLRSKNAKNKE